MHLCRHLAKYRHVVSDPNGRVPKSSTYHKNAKQKYKPKSITYLSNIPYLDDKTKSLLFFRLLFWASLFTMKQDVRDESDYLTLRLNNLDNSISSIFHFGSIFLISSLSRPIIASLV